MRKLPEANRYYLMDFGRGKTHLVYFTYEFGRYEAHQACFPNMPVEIRVGCNCDYYDTDCTPEYASEIDSRYNELTCPTCLKMAQGKPYTQLELVTANSKGGKG